VTKVNNRGENQLLSLLPPADRKRVLARCDKVSLDIKTILYEANGRIADVYFPLSGMVSLVINNVEGDTIEVGSIGNEGMVGTPLVLGSDKSPVEALVQVAMHTQHHRGQCMTRLKDFGGEPKNVDWIIWLWKQKPSARWE